ncbi:tetratricopeptide repeat protein [Defluviimonas sp. SAOS-178_SWC]|uniref:tetratricopeptide repeat protein n=1 Tax=Defluviimonas sp. SAOS-178_SWC TaxID=3121287 RepID=UPI0032220B39
MRRLLLPALWAVLAVQPALAERLTLNYLPPDLPPSNVCNADPEERDPAELQEGAPEEQDQAPAPEDVAFLDYLTRDIRDLTHEDADRWFDFITVLINRRAELDPGFAGIEEAFARIDVYVSAGRLDALRSLGAVEGLARRSGDLTNSQKVRLARLYWNGIGVAEDRGVAEELITTAAFAGNADALMEALRLQVAGGSIETWDLAPEETATLAFGGMVGRLNRGICDRAERMAREYEDGDILTPNPDLAYAWRKFAADLGGAEAAWRVVEYHLSATAGEKDNEILLHYLSLAVRNGYAIEPGTVEDIVASGATTEAEIRKTLGYNYNRVGSARRRTAVPYLDLQVHLTGDFSSAENDYLRYLREVAALPGAPASILTRLAKELLQRRGRWAAEAEATVLLEQAAARDDPDAIILLANILMRYRGETAKTSRTENLLIDAVSRLGRGDAMNALDALYRCKFPGAPMLPEAQFWANVYRTADVAPVGVSPTDLAKFDTAMEPEAIAKIQSLALQGHGSSTADQLQLLQADPAASDAALRFWAVRVSRSDQALEDYVKQEFEHALTRGERYSAVELFRRAFLDIGPSISLDLAVTLVKHAGRDPTVVSEIEALLKLSAQRGEGAAIRLLQRLTGRDGEEVYRTYADAIETRGDFLALMYAAPYVPDDRFDDYMDRAISEMNCFTKDVAELADAYALRERPDQAYHWLQVGLAMEKGHVLSKLGLSDQQLTDFGRGKPAPTSAVDTLSLSEGDQDARRRLYLRMADPDDPAYDPEAAATHLETIVKHDDAPTLSWALAQYRRADQRLRDEIAKRIDLRAIEERAAQEGDSAAQFELGMLLRTEASGGADLNASATWLLRAAEAGHTEAMVEYAVALGFGLGIPADPKFAEIWLREADSLGNPRARDLMNVLSAMARE